jgi:transcription elongation GreA/GreB family factor
MDKRKLLKSLIHAITADLKKIQVAAQASMEGAIHEENRAEGNKDMRSTEASYLARGQAMRVAELTESLNRLHQMPLQTFNENTPVSAGALVRLETTSGRHLWYWVVTHGAGYELVYNDMVITTITPRSPLGRELVERFLDDGIDLFIGGRHEHYEIVELI